MRPRAGIAPRGASAARVVEKRVRAGDHEAQGDFSAERRRASRGLWAACEALLSSAAEPRALRRGLDDLREAFAADGVALQALAPSGEIEAWCARGRWQTSPGDLRECLCVPLFRAGERVGTLDLKARAGARWRPDQYSLIRTAAGALGAALGARIELDRLRCQPGRDPVTGLPDSRAFHQRLGDELARVRRGGLPVAVVLLGLDRFQALNARFGRATGDAVLAEAALVLKLALRESDLLARLGGDSFAALLPDCDQGPALRCAERLRRALEQHHFPRVARLGASAGVAASPRDGLEAVELMACADQTLSVAKKSGRRRAVANSPAYAH